MPSLPKFVARINFKPLAPEAVLGKFDPEKVLRDVRREILRKIRQKIRQSAFSPRAKKALATGVKTKLGPRSLTILATHPAFFPLVAGQKREQMRWLQKSTTPIPIVLDSGDVIFRQATSRSMNDGRWIHPGRQPTRIVDSARKEAREIVKKRMVRELKRQLRESIKK